MDVHRVENGDPFERPELSVVDPHQQESYEDPIELGGERDFDARIGQLNQAVVLQDIAFMVDTCAHWNPMAAVDNTAVVSDIPTLILAGQYDTATPPWWADLTAETLSDSLVFVFPGMGHSILSASDCGIAITGDFLDDPWSEPDASCIDDIEWPWFE